VYSKGAVDAALGGIRTGTAHAPQSIIKAALGPRPDGWTAADCDAPVASLSHSGNVVTVEAGLQVAYADGGRVQLSEELVSPQVVDLSAAADGTHHVYADIAEDGTFSGFGFTTQQPEVGHERSIFSTQEDVTNVTTDTSPLRGDPNILVDGSLADYVHWGIKTPTVVFSGVSGELKSFSIFSPRSQGQPPKSWVIEGLKSGVWEEVGTGSTSSIDDWTEDRYIASTITSSVVYEQFRLRVTDSWGAGCIFSDVLFSALSLKGDLYNPVTVTMYDTNDNPIRRVYLGWVEKFGGTITDVHCYSLGSSVTLPVNNGSPIAVNTQYTLLYPFQGSCKDLITREFAEIKINNEWYSAKTSEYSGNSGVGVNPQTSGIVVVSKADALLSGTPAATGSPYSGSSVASAWSRISAKRGY
jgi:hypothetical protein